MVGKLRNGAMMGREKGDVWGVRVAQGPSLDCLALPCPPLLLLIVGLFGCRYCDAAVGPMPVQYHDKAGVPFSPLAVIHGVREPGGDLVLGGGPGTPWLGQPGEEGVRRTKST